MALTDEVWLCSNRKCDSARYLNPCEENNSNCSFCNSEMIKTPLLVEEYAYITLISEDRDFIDAMIELKQKDIIEFKTKIAQFKAQVDAEEDRKRKEKINLNVLSVDQLISQLGKEDILSGLDF